MPRDKSPERIEAKKRWLESGGKARLKDIAKQLGISDSLIRKWKNIDKWDRELNGNVTEKKTITDRFGNVTVNERRRKRREAKKLVDSVHSNEKLNDKEKLFCLYYCKSFNATTAYQKVYGCQRNTALAHGYKMLRRPDVIEEIKRLKEMKAEMLLMDEADIVEKYMQIAFSDIEDYLEWGHEDVPVMTQFGPLMQKNEETGASEPVLKTVNFVRFRPSDEVDGTLLSEVKKGREGASIKLPDRMKALEWLSKYFVIHPEDKHRLEYERKKAAMDTQGSEDGITINIRPASQAPDEEEEP